MKNVFSIIWKILAIAMICVGVYLLIQVLGESESVIESYEQLTGNSIGATSSIKISFLREYIKHTGNTDILITLGITSSEKDIILSEDNLFDGADPDEDTQLKGTPDPNNPSPTPGQGGQGTSPTPGTNPSPAPGTNPSPPPSNGNARLMRQEWPEIANLKGGSTTMSGGGCGIVALYNAYYCNTVNPISMKEMLLRYSNEKLGGAVKEDANGNLVGTIGDLMETAQLWNWIKSTYNISTTAHVFDGNMTKTVNQGLPGDGKYLIYYQHAGGGDKRHWVYADVTNGNISIHGNENKGEGNNIGNLKLRTYYKLG